MAPSRKIEVEIIGDSSSVERAFGRASQAGRRFSVGFGTFLKGAVVFEGVRAAVDLTGKSIRTAAGEWKDMVTVAAQTAAVLESTGGIAGVTADHVDKLAESIARYSGQDDEAVQAAANLLLTFKEVRNEAGKGNAVFDRATKAAADLSQAGFGSLSTTAKQLGKALNDPVRGMTALGRAGVTFSAAQRKTITELAKTGKTLEAQKIILREVESQVGGSARAFGETLPGQLARARESIKNTLGGLVAAVAPALTATLDQVNKFIDRLGEARTVRAKLNVILDTGRQLGQQVLRIAEEVRERVGEVLAQIDWRAVGREVGDGLARGLAEVAAFVQRVDWGAVGTAIVSGISDFLKGVNWPAVLKATAILLVRAVIALDTLLFNASKELGRQILLGVAAGAKAAAGIVSDAIRAIPGEVAKLRSAFFEKAKDLGRAVVQGIGAGLDNAKNAVIRNLLELVNKLLGVTGFLGRFDPFKGVRERVQGRLREMEGDTKTSAGRIQRSLSGIKGKDVTIGVSENGASRVQAAINAIKGKDVLIRIKTQVESATRGVGGLAVGAADAAATETDNDVAGPAVAQAEKQAAAQAAAAKKLADAQKRAAAAARAAAAQAAKAKEAAVEAFGVLMDSLGLGLEQAQATKSFQDDLKILSQQEDAIREQIKIEGRTTELLRELFSVGQQRKAIQQQIREQRAERTKGLQFEKLGLTETGEQRVPGVAALKKRLGNLSERIKGTVLDTPKTQAQLARIANVLSGKFGKVGRDVRSAILAMFKDITGALEDGGKETASAQTAFKKVGVGKLIEGIGLSPAEIKELRQRLSQVGPGGTTPSKGFGAFGFASPGVGSPTGDFVVNTTVNLDGDKVGTFTTRFQQKQVGRNATSRRGTRAWH